MAATTSSSKKAAPQKTYEVETIAFEVELANGNKVSLEAIKNRDDMDLEALEHAQLGNYAVFLRAALTDKSNFMLKANGAKVRDYETISTAYGEAVGAIEED